MKNQKTKLGSSIIEIIVGIGILTFVSFSIVTLSIGAYTTSLRDTEKAQALAYLTEGVEATRAIKSYNFSDLTDGDHGLDDSSGYWDLSGSSDTVGQFTRTLTVSNINRDGTTCEIVTSGGTNYGTTKEIEVSIDWDLEAGNSTSISATQLVTDYNNPPACGVTYDSDSITIDDSGMNTGAGGKDIKKIFFNNIGAIDITVTKTTVTWDNTNEIEEIKVKGGVGIIWKKNGYVPDGKQPSGTELDVTDFIIPAGGSVEIDKFKFDGSMTGSTISIQLEFGDGSTLTLNNITP